jgi:hypothetical protein
MIVASLENFMNHQNVDSLRMGRINYATCRILFVGLKLFDVVHQCYNSVGNSYLVC